MTWSAFRIQSIACQLRSRTFSGRVGQARTFVHRHVDGAFGKNVELSSRCWPGKSGQTISSQSHPFRTRVRSPSSGSPRPFRQAALSGMAYGGRREPPTARFACGRAAGVSTVRLGCASGLSASILVAVGGAGEIIADLGAATLASAWQCTSWRPRRSNSTVCQARTPTVATKTAGHANAKNCNPVEAGVAEGARGGA